MTYQPFAETPAIEKLSHTLSDIPKSGTGLYLLTKALKQRGGTRLLLLAVGGLLCWRAFSKAQKLRKTGR